MGYGEPVFYDYDFARMLNWQAMLMELVIQPAEKASCCLFSQPIGDCMSCVIANNRYGIAS
jgi:hypothetical protein